MRTKTDLKSSYQKIVFGEAWYGKDLMKTIGTITSAQAASRINGSYNCAELVAHMIRWRKYVTDLIETSTHIEVKDSENFPTINEITADQWTSLCDQLDQSFDNLMIAIDNFSEDLDAMVPSSKFTWKEILVGIVNHDIYHCGQLNLLAKFA